MTAHPPAPQGATDHGEELRRIGELSDLEFGREFALRAWLFQVSSEATEADEAFQTLLQEEWDRRVAEREAQESDHSGVLLTDGSVGFSLHPRRSLQGASAAKLYDECVSIILDKAPWAQGPGVAGGILHILERLSEREDELERLREAANDTSLVELLGLIGIAQGEGRVATVFSGERRERVRRAIVRLRELAQGIEPQDATAGEEVPRG